MFQKKRKLNQLINLLILKKIRTLLNPHLLNQVLLRFNKNHLLKKRNKRNNKKLQKKSKRRLFLSYFKFLNLNRQQLNKSLFSPLCLVQRLMKRSLNNRIKHLPNQQVYFHNHPLNQNLLYLIHLNQHSPMVVCLETKKRKKKQKRKMRQKRNKAVFSNPVCLAIRINLKQVYLVIKNKLKLLQQRLLNKNHLNLLRCFHKQLPKKIQNPHSFQLHQLLQLLMNRNRKKTIISLNKSHPLLIRL